MILTYGFAWFLALCLASAILAKMKQGHKQSHDNGEGGWEDVQREGECQLYKELYYKLHHLEDHADGLLPKAKSMLLSFLSEALQSERGRPSTILSLEHFSASALQDFIRAELKAVTEGWHHYLVRRKAGRPRELFPTADDARRWLVRMAPVKLVDGAWLGHIHKATTRFADRHITRAAWQILSEELGDGDVARNHVQVYVDLLGLVAAPVAAPDSVDFIRHPGMDDARVWRSAVAQLLVSLFPHQFLPEILGFNLHFEMLTLETLVTAKELRELGFDPYYFTLHVTIDNVDSGHTAMASQIVTDYLGSVADRDGATAAQQAWRRVRAGFVLSKNLPSAPTSSPLVAQVLAIFEAKAAAADRIHENCPMSFGGRSLSSWLDPRAFARPEWRMDFLRRLGNTKPWVYRGDSGRSRLIHQLSWGGPMFGAFTDREVAVLRDWIDGLVSPGADDTLSVSTPRLGVDYPVFVPAAFDLGGLPDKKRLAIVTSRLQAHRLLPLWFTHICLLESFVCVPWRVANTTGCAIVRFLRAQYGFLPEPLAVAGMDEMRREDHVDLVDVGLEMLSRTGQLSPALEGLKDVLERWPSAFAETMLAAAMRPEQHKWMLLGMAQAFVQLHQSLASSESDVLSPSTRSSLGLIAEREEENLAVCVAGLQEEEERRAYREFWTGQAVGLREIERCFI
ncbi:hypothetical protein L249_6875 [Ophiocordyceps polyrhachis-furcata BCC 54312]|uniref:Uncharacterized protein n=1 Tax=Ophiocordyceps polyrhachis-furcata BCC 54312 TaxID=1330021 RepID=A0A367LJH7_9HYPO|nr:hypothetical protein L249_6875 [Ophiocordyceps polyrhachis-furcata BCC 54312]